MKRRLSSATHAVLRDEKQPFVNVEREIAAIVRRLAHLAAEHDYRQSIRECQKRIGEDDE